MFLCDGLSNGRKKPKRLKGDRIVTSFQTSFQSLRSLKVESSRGI